jgi:hypothetical protein
MIPKTPADVPQMDAPASETKPLPKQQRAPVDDLATGEGGTIDLPSKADDMNKDD